MSQTVLETPKIPHSAFKPGSCPNPGGKSKLQLEFSEFLDQSFEEQRKTVDQTWLELAYVLPRKALRLALTAEKREMGQVQQIVTAAAIAKDKRFPASDDALTVRIPAKMLGSYSCAIILKKESAVSTDVTPTT